MVVAVKTSALTYLHGGLRVGVVGRLEAQRGDADLVEEGLEEGDKVPECEVVVGDEELYLVELGEVRGVHRLVSEHAVDGKVLFRGEHSRLGELLAQLVAGARGTHAKYTQPPHTHTQDAHPEAHTAHAHAHVHAHAHRVSSRFRQRVIDRSSSSSSSNTTNTHSILAEIAVVWVRSRFLNASPRFHL